MPVRILMLALGAAMADRTMVELRASRALRVAEVDEAMLKPRLNGLQPDPTKKPWLEALTEGSGLDGIRMVEILGLLAVALIVSRQAKFPLCGRKAEKEQSTFDPVAAREYRFGPSLMQKLEGSHAMTSEELANVLHTHVGEMTGNTRQPSLGLSDRQVEEHQQIFGRNALTPAKKENPIWLLIKQVFGGLFNIMLWICVACELTLALIFDGDDTLTPLILSMVIVASGTLQWWTELQAESMMESLQNMQRTELVCVYRSTFQGGKRVVQETWIEPGDLVPGELVVLEAGDKIPADIRIVFCTEGAEVDNAALTGESLPEARTVEVEGEGVAVHEAHNVCFFGTTVLKGKMKGIVFATGDDTFLGQINETMTQCARTRSTLETQIEHFVHVIAYVAMAVGILSLVANLMSPVQRPIDLILENAATAFFAQVPEGLLPTVTISLMIASTRMVKKKVLVRKIDAIETLGCVSVLCSDKTGTLTSGCMTATDVVTYAGGFSSCRCTGSEWAAPVANASVLSLAQCGILNNSSKPNREGVMAGSPTEVAIMEACTRVLGDDRMQYQQQSPQVFEIPFNSETKWMLTIHADDLQAGAFRMVLKGAPERVLAMCTRVLNEASTVELTDQRRAEINASLHKLMSGGRRVLCFAEMRLDGYADDFVFEGSSPEKCNFPMAGFTWVGLIGLEDPPKEGVKEAIAVLDDASCKTVMVTGDHPTTAQAIATRIGILKENELANLPEDIRRYTVVTGSQLADYVPDGDGFEHGACSEEQMEFWRQTVQHARVFARVSPVHKRVIVRAYQQIGGAIVAMTGDGVNDAPALKAAEVGIAMGIRGTEVAKEAADIVLLDDQFTSVVEAMGQGRLCSENLKKSIMYTLCSKIPQVMPTFAELLGVPTALTVTQVLLIDIGTDIWTAIAYAFQPAEASLMSQKPRHPLRERMVDWTVLVYSYFYIGMIQMAACWFVFFSMPHILDLMHKHSSSYTVDETKWNYAGMAAYYWTLVLGQLGAAMVTTTTRTSLLSYGLPNKWLNVCFVLEVLLAATVIYWEPCQRLFKTEPLNATQALMGCTGLVAILFVEEIRKACFRWGDTRRDAKAALLLLEES
mmetsp:Transcript_50845/g.115552  ORF Transcript_50845/g.115552 Transcript_50845/m.115552 type:complete len:1098 (+) Transcript_50845:195-3488(+)